MSDVSFRNCLPNRTDSPDQKGRQGEDRCSGYSTTALMDCLGKILDRGSEDTGRV
jgi:hypothetical protein